MENSIGSVVIEILNYRKKTYYFLPYLIGFVVIFSLKKFVVIIKLNPLIKFFSGRFLLLVGAVRGGGGNLWEGLIGIGQSPNHHWD